MENSDPCRIWALEDFDAVVLDLDGVITRTAKVHARAWKRMFDDFLAARRQKRAGGNLEPFDIEEDYSKYVDGKPRYDGVASFLKARGVSLPRGDPDDDPARETVCGLGNRKNRFFLDLIHRLGVESFQDTRHQIRKWKRFGLKLAVVSSSRNCAEILQAAGLKGFFDTRVDGITSGELGLKGKPAPDVFLEAARRLDARPERSIAIEDAPAGVHAGRAGGFGLVVGIDRKDHGKDLEQSGAHIVVRSLLELRIAPAEAGGGSDPSALPHALENDPLAEEPGNRRPAMFFDYDGTLTPIVSRPDQARLSQEMRSILRRLSKLCPVAIVSGRDRKDVRNLVGLEGIVFAGSHGFDISGPNGLELELAEARALLPEFDACERELRKAVAGVAGAEVERKRFSIAAHYRNAERRDVPAVEHAVDEALDRHPHLCKSGGKEIFELRPALDWNKGDAVLWLFETLSLDLSEYLPVYLGDDLTDEDAFAALEENGIGIVTGTPGYRTRARYFLRDPGEVALFLRELVSRLQREKS